MTGYHRLAAAEVDALATGLGGPDTVRRLGAARLSRHLLMLRYVVSAWPGPTADRDGAVTVLAEVQRRSPRVYERLLGAPLTGAWLARAIRTLRGVVEDSAPVEAHLDHLGVLAAAAAASCGLDAEL